jgi:deoxyribonuclease IV
MGMPAPFDVLHFGTAGIPHSGGGGNADYPSGLRALQHLGLSAAELPFVQSVDLSESEAKNVGSIARECSIILSAHAPYYVNLASLERPKIHASISRIVKAAKILHAAGGHSVVFHAAFYQERPKEDVYTMVAQGLQEIESTLKKSGIDVWIRPELTGKPSQFGDPDELIRLAQEFEMVLPCIDFSHLHARSGGRFNTMQEWDSVVRKLLEDTPKEKDLRHRMHIHLSGIDYTPKGEKKHMALDESDLNYEPLLHVLKRHGVCGTVICEGPEAVMVSDAQTLKSAYEKA